MHNVTSIIVDTSVIFQSNVPTSIDIILVECHTCGTSSRVNRHHHLYVILTYPQ